MEKDKKTNQITTEAVPTPQHGLLAKIKEQKRLSIGIATTIIIVLLGIVYLWTNSTKIQPEQSVGKNTDNTSEKTETKGPPIWAYHQEKLEWFIQSGTAPVCKEPFKLDISPVDMTKVTAVGLPGAYRGFSYKAHGGFRVNSSTGGNVDVKMPIDANLTGITRYYESIPGQPDELQYLLSFESDCGIAFRFDHLSVLTPEIQTLAEKTAPPKKDNTASTPGYTFEKVPLKAGYTVATGVGFPIAKNYGFDFGVYDYRERNKISHNEQWAAIHSPFSATEFHGVCWISLLPDDDAAKAEAMANDRNNYNSSKPFNLTSDYCDFAPHKTLEFNNGQPTEG
jgi:hypothetical protein